jgi:hypothetical protein
VVSVESVPEAQRVRKRSGRYQGGVKVQDDTNNDPYYDIYEGYKEDDADGRKWDSTEPWNAGVLGAHFLQEARLAGLHHDGGWVLWP